MVDGAKVCDLTEDLLWFLCGLYVGNLTSSLNKHMYIPVYHTNGSRIAQWVWAFRPPFEKGQLVHNVEEGRGPAIGGNRLANVPGLLGPHPLGD